MPPLQPLAWRSQKPWAPCLAKYSKLLCVKFVTLKSAYFWSLTCSFYYWRGSWRPPTDVKTVSSEYATSIITQNADNCLYWLRSSPGMLNLCTHRKEACLPSFDALHNFNSPSYPLQHTLVEFGASPSAHRLLLRFPDLLLQISSLREVSFAFITLNVHVFERSRA